MSDEIIDKEKLYREKFEEVSEFILKNNLFTYIDHLNEKELSVREYMESVFPHILEDFPHGLNEEKIPEVDDLLICIHLPGTGGFFLNKIIGCHDYYGGEEYIKTVINDYSDEKASWSSYGINFLEDRIHYLHSRDVDFENILDHKKIVFITYDDTELERNFLVNRLKTLPKNALNKHRQYTNLQLKYHKVVHNFLEKNHPNFHKFPFSAYISSNNFAKEVNRIFEYLNLPPMNTDVIVDLHKIWVKANARHALYMKNKMAKLISIKIEEELNQ